MYAHFPFPQHIPQDLQTKEADVLCVDLSLLRTFSEGKSGSSWQRRARKLPFSLHSVVFVVRNTVPPTFSFIHSSFEFILSVSSVLDWLEEDAIAPSLAAGSPELAAASAVGDCPVAMFFISVLLDREIPSRATSRAKPSASRSSSIVRPLNSIDNL